MVGSNSEAYARVSHLVEEGESVELLHNQAESGKHGNAAVLELSLAENLDIKNIRETEGIEADIAGQGSVEVGGLLEERHRLGEGSTEHSHARSGGRCTTTMYKEQSKRADF
jgi:hypothetical protein